MGNRKHTITLTMDTTEMDKEIEIMEQRSKIAHLELMERFKINHDIGMDILEMLIFGDQDE
jgi:hypothetical protein